MQTKTESPDSTNMMECAIPPFTSSAYFAEASAMMVSGYEYAHHAMLKLLIDFLNRFGHEIRDMKRNKERKNNILAVASNFPVMESQARLAKLGTAKKRKKTGLNIVGKVLVPVNL